MAANADVRSRIIALVTNRVAAAVGAGVLAGALAATFVRVDNGDDGEKGARRHASATRTLAFFWGFLLAFLGTYGLMFVVARVRGRRSCLGEAARPVGPASPDLETVLRNVKTGDPRF